MSETGGPHFLLNVRCPGCGSTLQFHQTVAGQPRRCPKCKTTFRVSMRRRSASDRTSDRADELPGEGSVSG